tara:strand:+ start:426 stop:671 length:246 start_codon:yes stop_codon:yes gene_type:complete
MSVYDETERASHELALAECEGMEVIAYAILKLSYAAESIASAIRALGNADAATPMGAIEAYGSVMKDGMGAIADAIRETKQ